MASRIDRPIRSDQRTPASGQPTAARYLVPQSCTTPVERFLLFTVITILPLENYFPTLAGMSSSFLLFAMLAAYIIVNRPRILDKIWYHPIFIAAYAFIGVSGLLEFSSPHPKYEVIIRFGQMIGGAVCVAVLCRDRSALTAGLYGYIATALWVSVALYLTSYGALQGIETADFNEASKLRSQSLGKPMGAGINGLAILCVQGANVAFALCLSDRWKHLMVPLLGIIAFCITASFLTMSRGAAVLSLVSFAVISYAHGFRQGKALIFACVIGMAVYMVVPNAVWPRMAFSEEKVGENESRTRLYTAALDHLPEYIVAGVGAGNFYGSWGVQNGFGKKMRGVMTAMGVHNTFVQIPIYWGVLGLLTFLWIVWWVYRSIPLRCGRDGLSLALLGISVSLGLWLLQSHIFFNKPIAFAIGMLVGSQQGIWPRGIVSPVEEDICQSGGDSNISPAVIPR